MDYFKDLSELLGTDSDTIVLLSLNLICGFIGAWFNYCFNQFKTLGFKWSFKTCKDCMFPLFWWCVLGGLTAVFFAPLKSYKAAFLAGFGAIAIWDQFAAANRGTGYTTTKKVSDNITKNASKQLDESYKLEFEELKKFIDKAKDEDANGD